jgi:small conductance mechanosensitive channel
MGFDLDRLGNLLVIYGINLAGAIVVALIGWWAASLAQRTARRALLASSPVDPTLAYFLSSLARYAILLVTFLVILQLIGIQATSLIAVLGAASLAVGLALQGTLSDIAAGVMLLFFRPFKIGDSIEVAGKSGTVRDLNLFMTELASGDNVQVLMPNRQVWGTSIVNLSTYPDRRLNVTISVPLQAEVDRIASEIDGFLRQDSRVLDTPAPSVTMASLKGDGIELSVQAWAGAADAGAVREALMRQLQMLLRSPGERTQTH